jgi:hypothetical protein
MSDKKPIKDKVAIVGFAPASAFEMNNLDDTWEVWGINELYTMGQPNPAYNNKSLNLNKFTRWFEIHDRATYTDLDTKTPAGKAHIDNLKQMPFPVYMQDVDKYKDVPNAKEFPLDEVCRAFPRKYFTNTPALLLAFAVAEGMQAAGADITKFKWKQIALFGVDMSQGWNYKVYNDPVTGQQKKEAVITNEYATQRPSCEYVIGYIEGLYNLLNTLTGTTDYKFILPEKSSLCRAYNIYGFEGKQVHQLHKDLKERLAYLKTQQSNLQNNMNAINGQAQQELAKMGAMATTVAGNIAEVEFQLANYHID